jgi:hypothetical protein
MRPGLGCGIVPSSLTGHLQVDFPHQIENYPVNRVGMGQSPPNTQSVRPDLEFRDVAQEVYG